MLSGSLDLVRLQIYRSFCSASLEAFNGLSFPTLLSLPLEPSSPFLHPFFLMSKTPNLYQIVTHHNTIYSPSIFPYRCPLNLKARSGPGASYGRTVHSSNHLCVHTILWASSCLATLLKQVTHSFLIGTLIKKFNIS